MNRTVERPWAYERRATGHCIAAPRCSIAGCRSNTTDPRPRVPKGAGFFEEAMDRVADAEWQAGRAARVAVRRRRHCSSAASVLSYSFWIDASDGGSSRSPSSLSPSSYCCHSYFRRWYCSCGCCYCRSCCRSCCHSCLSWANRGAVCSCFFESDPSDTWNGSGTDGSFVCGGSVRVCDLRTKWT